MFFVKNNLLVFFLLVLGFLLINTKQTKAQCVTSVSDNDSLALVQLYNATDGDNWTNNSGWLVTRVNTWHGITVAYNNSNGNCDIKKINLSSNNLVGTIPDLDLNNLEELVLSSNALSGNIPDFSNLPNLRELSLKDNQLSGAIPDFSNLPNLENLNSWGNQLSGSIPDFNNSPNLESLRLWENQLSGTIPDFSNLPNLYLLNASNNQLSGSIPNFSNLANLGYLSLDDNQLQGPIPDFSNLLTIVTISAAQNQLSGTIPDFSNLVSLTRLDLSQNQLIGSIPDFNNLPNLQYLLLHYNQLNGTVPDFSNLANLEDLYLAGNQLGGIFPDFSNLTGLESLSICPNKLVGAVPSFENCPALNMEFVDLSCIQSPTITGYAYYDLNNNCIKDEGEPTIANAFVGTTDNAFGTFTDSTGFYDLKVDLGVFTIAYIPPNYLWEQSCPTNYTETFTEYTDSLGGFNFANQAIADCPLMTINMATPLTRRCFTNTYTVDCCNTGTQAAEDVVAEIWFPEDIIPLSSSLTYTTNAEGALLFDLGTIALGECQSFTIVDSVSCDAILGSTACVEAFISPNDWCRPIDPSWDESNLIVSSVCLGNTVEFTIENIGENMADSTTYKMYEDDLLTAFEMIKLESGETKTITQDTDGQAFRLTANQRPGNPYGEAITDVVELCGIAPFSLGFVNSQPDEDRIPYYDLDCQEIIGSYDPNDKQATPTGIADGNYISDSTLLAYKVRFQNTGNDTAFTVIVVDTISPALDITTIQPSTSSHHYEFEYLGGQVAKWTFNNILLVDSTTNESASHGFFTFNIQQKTANPIGTIIENNAAIYFDFNEPIITNTVFHTVGIPEFEHPAVMVKAKVFLQEAYTSPSLMNTDLRAENLVPLLQPYARPPWNYNGTEQFENQDLIPMDVVDWVLVEVRDANNVALVLETKAALLLSNGNIVSADSPNATGIPFFNITAEQTYKLVIRHRNHIDLLSANNVSLPNTITYNFSQASEVEGGAAQLHNLGDGNHSMIGGDFTGDGVVTLNDFNLFVNTTGMTNTYSPADCNLDGHVTVSDFNYYQGNASKIGISAIRY